MIVVGRRDGIVPMAIISGGYNTDKVISFLPASSFAPTSVSTGRRRTVPSRCFLSPLRGFSPGPRDDSHLA